MDLALYLFLGALLLLFAHIVFRRVVRREYLTYGHLNPLGSTLQLLVFLGFFCYPYLFSLPDWPWFWRVSGAETRVWQWIGLFLIILGFAVAFGFMAWFGIGKAFGLYVKGLTTTGPYRISRNPQLLGGYLLVIGTSLLRPTIYFAGWIFMYALISHWMVLTEEEHLSHVFGEEYEEYCSKVPRYLFSPGK